MDNLARKEFVEQDDSEAFKLHLQPVLPARVRRLIEKLRSNYTFFSDMEEKEISDFLCMCKQEHYIREQKIFSQGEMASYFYLLVSGKVAILIDGTEVARLEAGEIFGEMALLEDIPRTATALTLEESILFSVPIKVLNKRLPILAYKVLLSVTQQLSAKLREANELLSIS